jgi:hypothetical protein
VRQWPIEIWPQALQSDSHWVLARVLSCLSPPEYNCGGLLALDRASNLPLQNTASAPAPAAFVASKWYIGASGIAHATAHLSSWCFHPGRSELAQ